MALYCGNVVLNRCRYIQPPEVTKRARHNYPPAEAVVLVLRKAQRNWPELTEAVRAPRATAAVAAISAGFAGAGLLGTRLLRLLVVVPLLHVGSGPHSAYAHAIRLDTTDAPLHPLSVPHLLAVASKGEANGTKLNQAAPFSSALILPLRRILGC